MKQLPESPGPSSQSPAPIAPPIAPSRRLSRRPRPLLAVLALGLAGAAGVGVVAWKRSDVLLGRIYEHWRPRLEDQVGKVMGRPLRLGPFQGLGPDGVRIGPSRFLPGPEDG